MVLLRSVEATFLVDELKHPDNSNLNWAGFILAHKSCVRAIIVGKELETTGHIVSAIMKQGKMNVVFDSCSLVLFIPGPQPKA